MLVGDVSGGKSLMELAPQAFGCLAVPLQQRSLTRTAALQVRHARKLTWLNSLFALTRGSLIVLDLHTFYQTNCSVLMPAEVPGRHAGDPKAETPHLARETQFTCMDQ
jgi:hypothetical protein